VNGTAIQEPAPGAAAERRVRLTIEYDGSGFAGSQRQPDARTVQGELERTLARLFQAPVRVAAAGRTDRGVHATGQVVSLTVPPRWDVTELARALNATLPVDLHVANAAPAPPDFHARFSACARGYVYRVGTAPHAGSPFLRRWCWPVERPLDRRALDTAAGAFRGAHDFRAFAKSGQPQRGYACTVHRAEWRDWSRHGLAFHVVADRFLHHMVRYMVGTMVDAARGARPAGDIARLLGDRPAGLDTSPPAPPEGLFLSRVYYAGDSLDEDTFDEILS
jgi:tRNA pseudouridine38-40 synthase